MKFHPGIGIVGIAAACLAGCTGDNPVPGKKGGAEGHAVAEGKKTTFLEKDNNTEAKLAAGELLELKLETRGGTGFSWEIAKNDNSVLDPKGKATVERADDAKPGAPEMQVFRFEAKAAGKSDLELHYRRPFDKDKAPEKTFKLTVVVAGAEKKIDSK